MESNRDLCQLCLWISSVSGFHCLWISLPVYFSVLCATIPDQAKEEQQRCGASGFLAHTNEKSGRALRHSTAGNPFITPSCLRRSPPCALLQPAPDCA